MAHIVPIDGGNEWPSAVTDMVRQALEGKNIKLFVFDKVEDCFQVNIYLPCRKNLNKYLIYQKVAKSVNNR